MATSTEKRQKVGLFQRFFHPSMSIFPRFPTFPAFSNFYSRTILFCRSPSDRPWGDVVCCRATRRRRGWAMRVSRRWNRAHAAHTCTRANAHTTKSAQAAHARALACAWCAPGPRANTHARANHTHTLVCAELRCAQKPYISISIYVHIVAHM